MNILLLADHFPPSFAPRMGYLTRNLKLLGHKVYVVAITHHRDFNSFDFLQGYADRVCEVKSTNTSHLNTLISILRGTCTALRPMWTTTDTLYYKMCKDILAHHDIDCLLCSTSSFYPLLVAERLKDEGIPTILDFRDIYEQDETFYPRKGMAGILRHFQKKIRNRIIAKANAVVSVSSWHCQYLSQWNSNCTLIMNGFDEQRFSAQLPWVGEKIRIVYTGTIATPKGDISAHSPILLFEAISELPKAKRNRLEVIIYTDSNSISALKPLIEKYTLQDVVQCNNWVKSDMVPSILRDSSALLILSNHGNKGVMLTKSFEYMAMNRPIICLPNPDSQLEKALLDTGTGFVLRDKNSIMHTLELLVDEKLAIRPNAETIMNFSRMSQAKQFEKLMTNIISK
ncbi:MAG: glycosyltransferase [Bacteroidia bacterium]|nr:glycosyltransferase [Bacteroidia bacterium]